MTITGKGVNPRKYESSEVTVLIAMLIYLNVTQDECDALSVVS